MSLVKAYNSLRLHKKVSALVRELLATTDAVYKKAFVSVLSRHTLDPVLDMNCFMIQKW
ncbi:hypothetical protein SpiBuddy_0766 [Sphaerochaeta globosa str. Buddy]|uniref:Uncharacterized protein n=1 Tax=Sphaerochaeta globosa (strain ATCC BAA-1886 / DSM 22777 / Buddy) TaxID=158189 RepID=F0RY94_SPHGB|nr:hypothetical protein SpiBuddy_0766 [Sphaerochaeta globosa str. Buddy]